MLIEQIRHYIESARSNGLDDQKILDLLQEAGWSHDDIRDSFAVARPPSHEQPLQQNSPATRETCKKQSAAPHFRLFAKYKFLKYFIVVFIIYGSFIIFTFLNVKPESVKEFFIRLGSPLESVYSVRGRLDNVPVGPRLIFLPLIALAVRLLAFTWFIYLPVKVYRRIKRAALSGQKFHPLSSHIGWLAAAVYLLYVSYGAFQYYQCGPADDSCRLYILTFAGLPTSWLMLVPLSLFFSGDSVVSDPATMTIVIGINFVSVIVNFWLVYFIGYGSEYGIREFIKLKFRKSAFKSSRTSHTITAIPILIITLLLSTPVYHVMYSLGTAGIYTYSGAAAEKFGSGSCQVLLRTSVSNNKCKPKYVLIHKIMQVVDGSNHSLLFFPPIIFIVLYGATHAFVKLRSRKNLDVSKIA